MALPISGPSPYFKNPTIPCLALNSFTISIVLYYFPVAEAIFKARTISNGYMTNAVIVAAAVTGGRAANELYCFVAIFIL